MTDPASRDELLWELEEIRDDTRVILSSGYTQQQTTEQLVGQGMAGFIPKPYELAALRRALCEALRE